jgi:succinate dehydrogenase/fumarate reductase flavoprotein subunit
VADVSVIPAFFELTRSHMLPVSGLSAAHTIYLAGGNVVVLDKQGFFGGNSTKATSGINGALTRTQVDAEIPDSVKKFYNDTLKSARDKARPDLIKVLTYKSAAAVEWLQDQFNLDLTLVSRLG